MKHIITHFLKKHNPGILVLRFGLAYSGFLALTVILLLSKGTSYYQYVELVLVAAIAAFFQTLIGYTFLTLGIKKDR